MRVKVIRDNAELTRRIGVWRRRGERHVGIHVRHAVEQIQCRALAAAASRGAGFVQEGSLTLRCACTRVEHVDDARREKDETGWITPVQGEALE